jgi:hypothetical protein
VGLPGVGGRDVVEEFEEFDVFVNDIFDVFEFFGGWRGAGFGANCLGRT